MRKVLGVAVLLLGAVAWGQTIPSTQPATQPNSILAKLAAVPPELLPVKGETQTRIQARAAWVKSTFPAGTKATGITGTIIESTAKSVVVSGRGDAAVKRDVQDVRLDAGKAIEVWGVPMHVTAVANIEGVTPTQALAWTKETSLTIDGPIKWVTVNQGQVDIHMDVSRLSPVKPAAKTSTSQPATAPAYPFPNTGSQL